MIGHHSRLRDVMGQSYLICACTHANHARYSSVHITFCGSSKHSLLLGKKLADRKCRAYRAISYKICAALFKSDEYVKSSQSRGFRGHNLYYRVTVLCTLSHKSFFLPMMFSYFFSLRRIISTLLLCNKKCSSFKRKRAFILLSS